MSRFRILVVLCALIFSGCASIPTDGAPQEVDRPKDVVGGVVLDPKGPTPGSSPENVVSDFLRAAGAGLSTDYSVARQFLTPEAAESWNPTSSVRVYQDSQNLAMSQTRSGAIRISATAQATIDDSGRYTTANADAIVNSEFSLIRNAAGEWRISQLDDGVIIPSTIFQSLYHETPLYFVTPDRAALVADVRWFPSNGLATRAVQALLRGPSSWLAAAVYSAVPTDTALSDSGVTISDGIARVDLSSHVASLSSTDLVLLDAQVSKTLSNLSGIQQVQLTSQGVGLDIPNRIDLPSYPYASYLLAGVSAGVPVTITKTSQDAITSVVQDIGALATSYTNPQYAAAVSTDRRRIYRINMETGDTRVLLDGQNLVTPSIDADGWVWNAEANSAKLIAVNLTTLERVDINVPWLAGATIRSLAMSREGSRLVVVSAKDSVAAVNAVAVNRSNAGVPTEAGDPIRFAPQLSDVIDIAWVSDSRLAVLGRQASTSNFAVYIEGIGVPSSSLSAIEKVVALTAGRGTDSIVLQSSDNRLYSFDGAGWTKIADNVTAPAYPG
ncbi:LpqB family beta-propeller domain-containing protein [Trueperella sp. LYQ143]|uniref:LpqB family beta-propeller domain-containing protein n=1 Tax=unclassified Trueperella TaxID=2630174 RepID=UPI00398397E0